MEQSILYKYGPTKLDEFVHEEQSLNFIKSMIETNNLNMLLFGAPGTGKTVLLNTIVNEYYNNNINKDNILYINNLNDQGISYYRNEMKIFCQSSTLIKNKKKLIVIDDLDTINDQGQQVFRSTLDKYSNNVHCIASCSNTLKDSGIPGSGILSPFTIASYAFARPVTSSDFTVKISCKILAAPNASKAQTSISPKR